MLVCADYEGYEIRPTIKLTHSVVLLGEDSVKSDQPMKIRNVVRPCWA